MLRKLIGFASGYLLLVGVAVWLISFCLFAAYALSFKYTPLRQADAIVVLTGGGDRIRTALNLLAENQAAHLLISGVHQTVQTQDLLASLTPEERAQITLGYRAKDTRGNAGETAAWVRRNAIRSIVLVTSFYHMPRSIEEVLAQSPSLKITPYPVLPRSFDESVDWIHTRYAWLLFVEYHKFMWVKARRLFERSR